MRVAVCLAGHMRTYDKTYGAWNKHVFEPFSPDVFIHTWSNLGTWKIHHDTHHGDHGTVHLDDDTINIDHIKSCFNPTSIVVENYDDKKDTFETLCKPIYEWRDSLEPLYRGYRVNSYYSAFYKVWACNELKKLYESENKYDLIIMSRPDVSPGPIPVISNSAIHIKHSSELKNGWMWNIMFVTNSENADLISSMYEIYIDKFNEAKELNIPHRFFEPHNILHRHLSELHKIEIIDNIPCEIVR